MRPVIQIVREKFIEGEPYKAALFGAFTSRKLAVALRKKIAAAVPVVFPNVEIVQLNLGHRHEDGLFMTEPAKGETDG